MISKATEPLKAELHALKIEVEQLRESQKFISNQNDDLTKTYSSVLQTNKQQKQDLTNLRKQTDDLSKHRCDDELKIDELEQFETRQNLELQGIPLKNNEKITQITLELAKQLDVELEEDISIAHRLPPNNICQDLDLRQPVNLSTGIRQLLFASLVARNATKCTPIVYKRKVLKNSRLKACKTYS